MSSPTVREEEPTNQPAKNSCDYTIKMLSSVKSIHGLEEAARGLMPVYDPMLDPRYFLASLSREWKPRVIVVKRGVDLVGVVYAQERTFWGIPTGIVQVDRTLHGSLLGSSGNRAEILCLALRSLLKLPSILSVQVKMPSDWPELSHVNESLSSKSLEIRYSFLSEHHAHFRLPSSYNDFLNTLGSTSRHNFRYYRRRFESEGHRYVPQIPKNALRSIALDLRKKCGLPILEKDTQSFLDMVEAADTPLAVGLQHANGEWLSVAAGCYRPSQAILLFQLNNDQKFARSSLSVVLRSHLIDNLIQAGCPELVILGGTAPPLSRYASHPRVVKIYVDKSIYIWRAMRLLSGVIGLRLPQQFGTYARTIASSDLPPGSPGIE